MLLSNVVGHEECQGRGQVGVPAMSDVLGGSRRA
jgi:hypothetical protein